MVENEQYDQWALHILEILVVIFKNHKPEVIANTKDNIEDAKKYFRLLKRTY